MAITVAYTEPIDQRLAADGGASKLPKEPRNFARDVLATVSGLLTFDNSYPTGGYALPNANFGLKAVDGVFIEDVNGYACYFNKSTGKVQVFSAAGTEVSAATNLSSLPAAYFRAEGRAY